ncbi:hypothetical protein ACFE04_024971 [Oxalis oulophora]
MASRYRNHGNGYKYDSSNFNSPTGHPFYNSQYHRDSSSRGFRFGQGRGRGRGQNISYHPPLPTPHTSLVASRNGDIFMEAGRLAAEYLVVQGLLPPTALSAKCHNKGFRCQDRKQGSKSALSRLGNSSFGGTRKYTDYMKGNARGGSFQRDSRNYHYQYGWSSSWSGRGRVSPDMDSVDGNSSTQYDDQLSGEDDAGDKLQSSSSGEHAPKSEEIGEVAQKREETGYAVIEQEKNQLSDDLGSKASFSGGGKTLSPGTDGEVSKSSDLDESTNNEPEKKEIVDDSSTQQGESNSAIDLISLCEFAKIPTKTRSSLTHRATKAATLLNNDEETNPDNQTRYESEDLTKDTSLDSISGKSNKTHDNLEVSEPVSVQSHENLEELGSNYGLEESKAIESQTFQNIDLGQRGEKRAIEESNDTWDGIKKARKLLQPSVNKVEETICPTHLSKEREEMAFPSSFKICDLNLMEGSHMNEMQNSDVMIIDHSVSETKNEPAEVDFDLSKSNSDISGEKFRQMNVGNDIEIIDLENDFIHEEKAIDNLEQRPDIVFTNLDSFSNNEHNSCPIDVEDHYDGLMITEYLNAFSNIPTIQENDGLPHGEDTLADDDDAIYMSLGEIPLSKRYLLKLVIL